MPRKTLVKNGYLPRLVDEQIERYLEVFGAVEVAGTKWCGKTWTALAHAQSVSYVDEELDMARADPKLMLIGDRPHVIDEWQLAPAIWNAVRHAIDDERGLRGAWLLTGSSTPISSDDQEGQSRHSGAGRIGSVRMYPFSLAESGESERSVSLRGLFAHRFQPAKVENDTRQLAELICRGGWPEALDLSAENGQLVAREYLRLVFEKSAPKHGKSGEVARRLCFSIARNLGQSPTYKTIISDMYGGEDNPSSLVTEQTLASYLEFLRSIYLVEEVPGWVPPKRSKKRLATKPKRYFADPSLAAALLLLSPDSLLADGQTFGLVFENLCIRDLKVYAQAMDPSMPAAVYYYRDDSGLEADAVIETLDGRWAAFEFKLSEEKVPDAVKSLRRLRKKVAENPRAQGRPPEFLCVITGIGSYAREVEEGIYVVPLRALAD